jgi:hypothetical protein
MFSLSIQQEMQSMPKQGGTDISWINAPLKLKKPWTRGTYKQDQATTDAYRIILSAAN